MEFFGIGPLELVLIFLIAIIVMGPNETVKAGMAVGKLIRRIRLSSYWRGFQKAIRSLRTLPENLARQAGVEELRQELEEGTNLNNLAELPPDLAEEIGMDAWRRQPSDADNPFQLPPAPPSDTPPADPEESQDE